MTRSGRLLYWVTPSLLCLILFWYGFRSWFQQDDFAWLGLGLEVWTPHDLLAVLFSPKAQGTIRPWSERAFFLIFHHFFGLHPAPYHAWVYANQCLDLVLLSVITRRITGSAVAGFLAPVLWTANSVLIVSLCWTAAYNEIQCSGFLLGAFYFFLRYCETGERRWWWAQFAVFTLGLGSLELDVVFPALAAAWAVLYARKRLLSTTPLFAVSLGYAILHRSLAPAHGTPIYQMFFDSALVTSLQQYWIWVIGAGRLVELTTIPRPTVEVLEVLLTLALLGFVVNEARRRSFVPLFGIAWFAITLAPVLPLKNHVTDYYLTMPAIGLAIVGACALTKAWTARLPWRAAAAICLVIYLGSSLQAIRAGTQYYWVRGAKVRNLVQSLAYIHERFPNKIVLLQGVDYELFFAGVYDRPTRIFGMREVYLTPDSQAAIDTNPGMPEVHDFFLPMETVVRAADKGMLVVYDVVNPLEQLRNVTHRFVRQTEGVRVRLPAKVDLDKPLFTEQLGPGWYGPEGGFRWMPEKATLVIGGPTAPGKKLYIRAARPAASLPSAGVTLTVLAEGRTLGTAHLTASEPSGMYSFDLPDVFVNRPALALTLIVDSTAHVAGDTRRLGLAVSSVEVR